MGEIVEKPRLYNWYLTKRTSHRTGEDYISVKGTVWGNDRFIDSETITSSRIRNIDYDFKKQMCVVTTMNTVYYCPMENCNIEKQEKKCPGLIGKEEILKILDIVKNRVEPIIDEGNILITLATYEEYYFHSMYYRKSGEKDPIDYESHAHVGTYQDSYLITSWDNKIDFRYFPHPYAVSFYSFENEEVPVFLENIGFDTICAETPAGIIKLEPGDRKLVDEENAEQEQPIILREDLYAATFL